MLTVFRKELLDLARDARTLAVMILFPILLFPLIFGFLNRGMQATERLLSERLLLAVPLQESDPVRFLTAQEGVIVLRLSDPEAAVLRGEAYAGLRLPGDVEPSPAGERSVPAELLFDGSSQLSLLAVERVSLLLDAYGKQVSAARMIERGLPAELLEPIRIERRAVGEGGTAPGGGASLLIVLPLLLLVYSATAPFAVAAALGAGEKERETLPLLFTTCISRRGLLLGKFAAVVTIGAAGVVACIAGFALSWFTAPVFFGTEAAPGLSRALPLLLLGLLTLLLIMAFGSLELAISFFARSSREAQTFFIPLLLISMAAASGTSFLEVRSLGSAPFLIPLVGASLLVKELLLGIIDGRHLLSGMFSLLLIAGIGLVISDALLRREEVVFRS